MALPDVSVARLIDSAHEQLKRDDRFHMGLSMCGYECDRRIWLTFRWAVLENHSGRTLRRFRRGHKEEDVVSSDLHLIGATVTDRQLRIDCGQHVSGSIDGIVSGIPGAPGRWLVEIKCLASKRVKALQNDGLAVAEPEYHRQTVAYATQLGLDGALFIAVGKDDDEIHDEFVALDNGATQAMVTRLQFLALAQRIPPKIHEDPSWYKCKMCTQFHSFCHEKQLTDQVHCRNCAHSTPQQDSTWTCGAWGNAVIPNEAQLKGCDRHVLHPDFVPWRHVETEHPLLATYEIDGVMVQNGQTDYNVASSIDLVTDASAVVDGFRRMNGA